MAGASARRVLVSLCAAACTAYAMQVTALLSQVHMQAREGSAPQSTPLKNDGDVQYTVTLSVGGQQLQAVLDTGSFDMVIFSQECGHWCGNKDDEYDPSRSKTFVEGRLAARQSYGSGDTDSREAWEAFRLADGLHVDHQVFWNVYDAYMDILVHGTFQAIFGVGPPASAIKMAQADVDYYAGKQLRRERRSEAGRPNGRALNNEGITGWNHRQGDKWHTLGNHSLNEWKHINGDTEADLEHYEEILEHAQREKPFVQKADVRVMSICLTKESGSPGIFVWNDLLPSERQRMFFQTVPVVGNLYWSADLKYVHIGDTLLGCGGYDRCSGIVDTGTSLIVAPARVAQHVEELVYKLNQNTKGCADLSSLPDISFSLGGQWLRLPPESYVGKVTNGGQLRDDIKHLMPHLIREAGKHDAETCESLLMRMDERDPEFGEMWILGLPLFRKYYTTFEFGPDFKAERMHFAEADSRCAPPDTEALERIKVNHSLIGARPPLNIDAKKIRVPTWIGMA